jgi:hypothetical protein
MKTTDEIMRLIDWQLSEDDVTAVRAAIDELQTEIKVRDRAIKLLKDNCDGCNYQCGQIEYCYEQKMRFATEGIEVANE